MALAVAMARRWPVASEMAPGRVGVANANLAKW